MGRPILRSAWDWLRRQLIDEVPEGDALCEYDCRKPQCTDGEWETCTRRIQHATGELMPEKKPEPLTGAVVNPQKDSPPAPPEPPKL